MLNLLHYCNIHFFYHRGCYKNQNPLAFIQWQFTRALLGQKKLILRYSLFTNDLHGNLPSNLHKTSIYRLHNKTEAQLSHK